MTDEQKAALQDALMPLQEWERASLEDIADQLSNAVRVCAALSLGCLPYQPPTEEQIAALAADASRVTRGIMGLQAADERLVAYVRDVSPVAQDFFKEACDGLLVMDALNAQADALIRLAGVPFGELLKPKE